MLRVARSLAPSLLLLSGCSFIDDFDKFGPRKLGDAGQDARVELDGEVPIDEDAGLDGATPDLDAAQPGGDASGDSGPPIGDNQCAGKPDGSACGVDGTLICLKGYCRTSRCGDGFVNEAKEEECDDANLTRQDGCEPGCRFSCDEDSDCDNQQPCDGQERCQLHRCVNDEVPATGEECTREDGASGMCAPRGYCVPSGCGNGQVDGNEKCEPPTLGCRIDCTQGCTSNAQCDDKNACNGVESCDTASGECLPGTALSCSDGDPCTADGQCSPSTGCTYPLNDADDDGVAPQTCAPGSPHRGGDCDDNNDTVFPGAKEYCDEVDNNCDGDKTAGAVMKTCYLDRDRDGYPTQQNPVLACECAAGTRPARADGLWDCWDEPGAAGADVHPGQTNVFDTPYRKPCSNGTCPSFDYDCNGREQVAYDDGYAVCGVLNLLLCEGEGWSGEVPACGAVAKYLTCSGTLPCKKTEVNRRQACR